MQVLKILSLYIKYLKPIIKLPKKIIIGIDPWIFNENNGLDRWYSLDSEFSEFRNEKSRLIDRKYLKLFSMSYFQNSIKTIFKKSGKQRDPQATNSINNIMNTICPDGSLNYGEEYLNVTASQVDEKARILLAGKSFWMDDFTHPSLKTKELLEKLLIETKTLDIEIEFCLIPFHPIVYNYLEIKKPAIHETETLIREISKDHNIQVYGSYNPIISKVTNIDFYDGMHLRLEAISRILKLN